MTQFLIRPSEKGNDIKIDVFRHQNGKYYHAKRVVLEFEEISGLPEREKGTNAFDTA